MTVRIEGRSQQVTYAARFYASVTDRRPIQASHTLGWVAIELNGLPHHGLPTLNEPPTSGRCDRIVAAALRAAEESLAALISSQLTVESIE